MHNLNIKGWSQKKLCCVLKWKLVFPSQSYTLKLNNVPGFPIMHTNIRKKDSPLGRNSPSHVLKRRKKQLKRPTNG